MKKPFLILFFTIVCFNVKASTCFYWVGAGNASYSIKTNWKTGGYSGTIATSLPTSNDTIRIGNISSNAFITLDIDTTIAVLITEGSGQVFINTNTSKTLSVIGNIIIMNTGTTGGGSSTIKICGTGNQTLSNSSTVANEGKLPNVTINKSSGTLFLEGYITMGGSTTLKLTAGTIDPGTSTVSFYLANTITGVINLYNVEFQGTSSTCSITDTLRVNDSLKLDGGSPVNLFGNDIKIKGTGSGCVSITNTSTFGAGSATIEFVGAYRQTLSSSVPEGEGFLPNIKISKTGDSLKLAGVLSIRGNWTNNYSTSYIAYGKSELFCPGYNALGGMSFNGSKSTPFYDVTFNAPSGFSPVFTLGKDSALIVKDSLKLTTGGASISINGHSILIEGSVINHVSGLTATTSLFIIGGAQNQLIRSTVSEGTGNFPSILIQKSAGTVTLKGTISEASNWTNNYDTADINCDTSTVFLGHCCGDGTQNIGGTAPCMFYNLSVGGTSNTTFALSRDTGAVVKHTLSIKGADNMIFNNHSLLALGDIKITNTSGTSGGSSKLIIGGDANQTISSTVSEFQGPLPSVVIQKSGGTLTMKGIISEMANWTNNYDTTHINCDTSTVCIGHCCGDGTQSLGGNVPCMFYNLNFGGSSNTTYTLGKDTAAIVKNRWKIEGGGERITESGHSMIVRGNVVNTNTGSEDGGSTIVILNGSANQIISSTATRGNGQLPSISIQKDAGTLSFSGVITLGGNWTNNYSTSNITYGTTELYFYNTAGATQNFGGSFSTPVHKLTLGYASSNQAYSNTVDSAFIVKDTLNLIGTNGYNLTISNHSLNIEGDILMNSACPNAFGSIFKIKGSKNQVLSGSYVLTPQQLIMNKSAGTLTLNKSMTITTSLTLITGDIISTSTNLLTLNNGATVSGASNSSFVSGTVKKIGNSAFKFPVGYGTSYNPISISAPSSTSDAFTAQYTNTNLGDGLTSHITYADPCEYWTVAHTAGSSAVHDTLFWNSPCFHIASLSYLKIVYDSTGSKWASVGTCTTSGNTTTGSIAGTFTGGNITLAKTNPLVYAHAGNDTSVCIGLSKTLHGSVTGGISPFTYSWSPATGLSSSTSATPTATPTVTTTYVLTVTDNLTEFGKDTVIVTVNSNPVAHAGTDKSVCLGSGVSIGATAVATGGTSPYTYSWSPATGLSGSTAANPTASPTINSTYILIATDHNTCIGKDTMLVSIITTLPVAHAGSDYTFCSGGNATLGGSPAGSGGTGMLSYSWFPDLSLDNSAHANPVASPVFTMTYVLTVSDSNGCMGKDTAIVNVKPTPAANAGSDQTICYGNSFVLGSVPSGSLGSGVFTYSWSPGADLSNSSVANPVASPSVTTTYVLTVTDSNSCVKSDTMLLTINTSCPDTMDIPMGASISDFYSTESYSQLLSDTMIKAGDTLLCANPRYGTPDWSEIDTVYSSDDYIELSFNQYSDDRLIYPFTYTVNMEVTTLDASGTVTGPFPMSLSVNYDPISGAQSDVASRYYFTGAQKVITQITGTSFYGPLYTGSPLTTLAPAFIAEQLTLATSLFFTLSLKFDCSLMQVPSHYLGARDSTQAVIYWTAVQGAVEYDVEYTFKDWFDHEMAYLRENPTEHFHHKYLFKNDATRVTVSGTEYLFPLIYPSGYVFYRVRAVKYDSYGNRMVTKWSDDTIHSILRIYPDNVNWIQISNAALAKPHEEKFNWQSTIQFAEEGKFLPKVSYFDGALYDRQDVTYSSQQRSAIVGETIYDYNGRPAVKVLPVPSFINEIKYYPLFNKSMQHNTHGFSRMDFDQGLCEGDTLRGMDTTIGSANYYSLANPKAGLSPYKFIPSADSFPFTTTEWTPDNTGRISRQSGLGRIFRFGYGHETKYFYNTPFQEELDGLFGKEVGSVEHYLKNMVVDPDSQVSVSYIDAHGRTIATALAGTPPKDLTALDSYSNTSSTFVIPTTNQTLDPNGPSLILTKGFGIESAGDVKINYTLAPNQYTVPVGCNPGDECYDCIYHLYLSLISDCPGISTNNNTLNNLETDFNTSCSNTPSGITTGTSPMTISDAPIGSYNFSKTLTLDSAAIAFYKAHYLATAPCIKTYQDFVDAATASIDPSGCHVSCQTCITQIGATDTAFKLKMLKQMYPTCVTSGTPTLKEYFTTCGSTSDTVGMYHMWKLAKQKCDSLCQVEDACQLLHDQLVADVSPGGQYAVYEVNSTGGYDVPSEQINHSGTCASSADLFYTQAGSTYPPYQTITYDPPTIQLDPNDPTTTDVNRLTIKQFVDNFKPSWAEALITLHPEYWYYHWCSANANVAAAYNYETTIDTERFTRGALLSGYFNPLGMSGLPSSYGSGAVDPITTVASIDLTDFEADMNNFPDHTNANDTMSIWAYAYYLAHCPESLQRGSFCTRYPLGGGSSCVTDTSNEWTIFRSLYTGLREEYLDSARQTYALGHAYNNLLIGDGQFSPPGPNTPYSTSYYAYNGFSSCSSSSGDITVNDYYNKQMRAIRFHSGSQGTSINVSGIGLNPSDPVTSQTNDVIEQGNQSCEANIVNWNNDLMMGGCIDNTTGTDIIKRLDSAFVQICRSGVDVNHPYGAIDMPTGSTGVTDITTGAVYHSFQDAITGILGVAPGDGHCSALLITSPGSYNAPQNWAVPVAYSQADNNPCMCDSLAALKAEFLASAYHSSGSTADSTFAQFLYHFDGSTLTQTQIDLLTAKCNDTTTCAYVTALKDSFLLSTYHSTYPDSTFFQFLYNADDGAFTQAQYNMLTAKCGDPASCAYLSQPIALPSILGCGMCADCKRIAKLTIDFLAYYPYFATHPDSPNYTIFYTQFMNDSTGYNLGFNDYKNFMKQCTLPDTGIVNSIFNNGLSVTLDCVHDETCATLQTNISSYESRNSVSDPNFTTYLTDSLNADYSWSLNYVDYYNYLLNCGYDTTANSLSLPAPTNSFNCSDFESFVVYFNSCNAATYPHQALATFLNGLFNINKDTSWYESEWTGACAGSHITNDTDIYDYWKNIGTECDGCQKYNGDVTAEASSSPAINASTTGYNLILIQRLRSIGDVSISLNLNELEKLSDFCDSSTHPFTICSSYYVNYSSYPLYTEASSGTGYLCAQPIVPPFPQASTDSSCLMMQLHASRTNATLAYNAYIDSVANAFVGNYVKECMQTNETITLDCNASEYHYTLYYYDQAGNLLRTIPPKAVVPNNSGTFYTNVDAYRNNPSSETDAYAEANLVPDDSFDLSTRYWYNVQNKPVMQKTPDADTTHYWYDQNGRIVLSQNSRQATADSFSYTLYDQQSRIKEVGQVHIYSFSADTNLLALRQEDYGYINDLYTSTSQGHFKNIYANFEAEIDTIKRYQVTHTYYDAAPAFEVSWYRNPFTKRGVNVGQQNLRSRVACVTYQDILDASTHTYSNYNSAIFYSYDVDGNVNTLVTDNVALRSQHNEFKRIDYDFDLVSGKVNYVFYQQDSVDHYIHHYEYDEDNKLEKVESGTDLEHLDQDAEYTYYDHGPLSRMVLGSEQVQGLDYAYTLQGWLKVVNGTELNGTRDMGLDQGPLWAADHLIHEGTMMDVIALTLNYFAGDYCPAGTGQTGFVNPESNQVGSTWSANSPNLYNGNIRSMSVALNQFGSGIPVGYSYHYDQLNRLMSMDVCTGYNSTTHKWDGSAAILDAYHEAYNYDENGNIIGLLRNDAFGTMDSLNYYYPNHNNQVNYVSDNGTSLPGDNDLPGHPAASPDLGQHTGNYSYDEIGELKSDIQGNLQIDWNVYGKIRHITNTSTGQIITFGYDPMGNRITKDVLNGTQHSVTYYVRDAQGNIMGTYTKDPSGTVIANDMILYGSSRLGRYKMNLVTYNSPRSIYYVFPLSGAVLVSDCTLDGPCKTKTLVPSVTITGIKEYELTNHLGNVLATISNEGSPVFSPPDGFLSTFVPQVVTMQDYYPFGMLQPGRTYTANSTAGYRFGFNGKEKDNEIYGDGNSIDFGARMYDSRLGRWLSTDPLQQKFASLSPYNFAGLNPILFKDIDGKIFVLGMQAKDDSRQELQDVQAMLPEGVTAHYAVFQTGSMLDGTAKFMTQVELSYKEGTGADDYKNDPGFSLVNTLINEKGVFEYDVSDHAEGINRVTKQLNVPPDITKDQTENNYKSAIDNLSVKSRSDYALDDFVNDLPTNGKLGLVRISPGSFMTYSNVTTSMFPMRSQTVFHELYENYRRSQGDDYMVAHNTAITNTINFSNARKLSLSGNTGGPTKPPGQEDNDNSKLFKHE